LLSSVIFIGPASGPRIVRIIVKTVDEGRCLVRLAPAVCIRQVSSNQWHYCEIKIDDEIRWNCGFVWLDAAREKARKQGKYIEGRNKDKDKDTKIYRPERQTDRYANIQRQTLEDRQKKRDG